MTTLSDIFGGVGEDDDDDFAALQGEGEEGVEDEGDEDEDPFDEDAEMVCFPLPFLYFSYSYDRKMEVMRMKISMARPLL
jgi:hypothetical protein